MRILDDESDKKLDNVSIFLTREELKQLIGYAEGLLNKDSSDHYHLSSDDYQKEITLSIYNPESTEKFNPRIIKLIKNDE